MLSSSDLFFMGELEESGSMSGVGMSWSLCFGRKAVLLASGLSSGLAGKASSGFLFPSVVAMGRILRGSGCVGVMSSMLAEW